MPRRLTATIGAAWSPEGAGIERGHMSSATAAAAESAMQPLDHGRQRRANQFPARVPSSSSGRPATRAPGTAAIKATVLPEF